MSLLAGTGSFVTQEDGRVLVNELHLRVQFLGEEKNIVLRLGQEVSTSELWVWKDIAPGTKGRISKLQIPATPDDRFIQALFEGQKLPRNFHYWELVSGDPEKTRSASHITFDGDDGSAQDLLAPVFNSL